VRRDAFAALERGVRLWLYRSRRRTESTGMHAPPRDVIGGKSGRAKVLSAHEAWTNAVRSIQERSDGLDLWLGRVNCIGIDEGRLLLEVPNTFTKDWISERYLPSILEELRDVLPGDLKVEFKLDASQGAREARPSQPPRAPHPAPAPRTARNPRFTFETFVEGPTNQLAVSACRAVASGAERTVSPVFICGPTGVGKTHLLCAIDDAMGGRSPRGPVIYVSAEAFMNEFVESIASSRMQEFRERYRRDVGVLLVDDIQFMATRERTQEEFFHVFNELYNAGRPIVLTSDRPPREIGRIEERLRSRFEWGLIADIRPPELATRIAIARRKAGEMGMELADEIVDFVAGASSGSVREIEGALIRLDVQSGLEGRTVSIEMAREVLGLISPPRSASTSVDDVIRRVAGAFGVKVSDLKGTRRHRSVARPRQVAMFMCRELLGMSYPEIGDRFGGRDHTTVMNACRRISALIESDGELRGSVEGLRRAIV
jgi:chromosomal replication initiator protein